MFENVILITPQREKELYEVSAKINNSKLSTENYVQNNQKLHRSETIVTKRNSPPTKAP
jgi:hypothetical protein